MAESPLMQTTETQTQGLLIGRDDIILVTGASGFIGARVIANLLDRGFTRLRCFARPTSSMNELERMRSASQGRAELELLKGNLLRREDCMAAAKDAAVIYHLAAGAGEKSFPDAFMNSVVTTRNLLDAAVQH